MRAKIIKVIEFEFRGHQFKAGVADNGWVQVNSGASGRAKFLVRLDDHQVLGVASKALVKETLSRVQ